MTIDQGPQAAHPPDEYCCKHAVSNLWVALQWGEKVQAVMHPRIQAFLVDKMDLREHPC